MSLLDHLPQENTGLKIVCEACGSLSIKPINAAIADDGAEIRCGRCDAIRGTVADLRELARRGTGEFEI